VREGKRKRRSRAVRLRRGEAVAGLSAIALFVLTFFPWYDIGLTGGQLSPSDASGVGRTAWETLEVGAPLGALVAVLTVAIVLACLVRPDWKPVIASGAAVAVLGGLATLGVFFRVLFPPDLGELGGIAYEASASLAAFLALAAAFGVAYGGYRAMREEGSSFAAVADSLQPRRGKPASRKRSRSSSD
jgi:hypothetical protein